MTLKEIAEELKVSPSTVSRVLNGRSKNFSVKPELRLKAAGMVLGHERGKAAPAKDEGAAEPEVLRFEGALEQWSR